MYAVVDIETTGGNASSGKITEIAIFIFDGIKVVDRYETLLNPEVFIPPYIESLTGISNEMVADAPRFPEVAKEIYQFLDGRIFVAHNVNFDYSFLKREFNSLGAQFNHKKLCTVRLSRKIIPGFPSYSLGNLCNALGIPITDRHRAFGDAEATVKLLDHLIKVDKEDFIGFSLKKSSKESWLPPNLPKEVYDGLPENPGVYYFHDGKGNVIYVGKAKNIKSRITGHFSSGSETKMKLRFNESIHDISYELCGNELVALLFESHEIKRLWPMYNRAQKSLKLNFGLFHYEDRKGYFRFSIGRLNKKSIAIMGFATMSEARTYLQNKVKEFNLCPKLSGLQKSPTSCFDFRISACNGACFDKEDPMVYNSRVQNFINSIAGESRSFIIKGQGRTPDEYTVVMVENGRYLGFGYVPGDIAVLDPYGLKPFIKSYTDTRDVQKILGGFVNKHKDKSVLFF